MNNEAATDPSQACTVEVPGARLACDVTGEGPPLVQLHGLTSSRRRDQQLELDLAEDVPDRRVVRYDARGHGLSTGVPRPEAYTWPSLADDALHVLDHFAPGEPVDAIGQSMGAATLLHAALVDPSRFRTLTLVIPPTAWATRPAQREAYRKGAELAETRGLEAFTAAATAMPRPPAAPPAPSLGPDVTEELLPSILRGAALSDLPDVERLGELRMPVLILAWVDDLAHPLETSETLATALPNSVLEIAHTPEESLVWGRRAAAHALATH